MIVDLWVWLIIVVSWLGLDKLRLVVYWWEIYIGIWLFELVVIGLDVIDLLVVVVVVEDVRFVVMVVLEWLCFD